MKVVHTRAELAAARAELHRPVALVPTMGALHEGHRTLIRRARDVADSVVVSIFVNPLQFGDAGDLARYPRTLETDALACYEEKADIVWAPSVEDMYPGGDPLVRVDPGPAGSVLEGAARPGHYSGVLTVVSKLFGAVRPDIACFGEKDAQQISLVRRMVTDLDLGVQIEEVPTVREADGLALSSRNRFLSAEDRANALVLSKAVRSGSLAAAKQLLNGAPGIELSYVEQVDPLTFHPTSGPEGRLVVAAVVGGVRLIDTGVI